jgi:CRISPR system Cascade subunit CasB
VSDRNWDVELVETLADLADPANPNRAVLAHLRRGLGGPPDYALGRVGWVFRRVPDGALTPAVLAAGLFAWVKGGCPHTPGADFGKAFGAGLTLEGKQRRERRFIDLLDTDAEELPYKLRQAITLISRDGVGLDWVRLIRHLRHWADPERWVQQKWARGFWAAPEVEATSATQPHRSE